MEGVDRLNELKDEMLVNNIMSRLDCTTKEVIQTTATISKRWKNLWTSLPHLFFSNVRNDCPGYRLKKTRRIDVTSKCVKKLVFSEYCYDVASEEDYIDCIKINAPYISSLTIKGELFLRELVLLNVSSLVEVDLKYSMSYKEFVIFAEEIFRGLLKSLGHVENITFGNHCSELLIQNRSSSFESVSDGIFPGTRGTTTLNRKHRWLVEQKPTLCSDGTVSANNARCEKDVDRIKKQFDDWMAFLLNSEHFLQPLALEKKWQADHICKTIATFLSEMKTIIDYKYSKGTFGRENFKD
ncbi:hypothetical protein Tco_0571160 [Tanacetum coccineum]